MNKLQELRKYELSSLEQKKILCGSCETVEIFTNAFDLCWDGGIREDEELTDCINDLCDLGSLLKTIFN